jgi:hypothetical protein
VLLVLLIISRLPVLHHKHPHELLDSVVKERSVKSFVLTEAAHSTAASFLVKLFLKNFSFLLNRLRFRSAPGFSSAGGEFYSVSNRCQPPTSSRFRSLKTETSFESTNPRSPAHSTRIRHQCNLYFHLSSCFTRAFPKQSRWKWCAL